ISMLSGLLKPTSGTAEIGGFDVGKEPRKAKELIGVCPQEAAVFKFLTGMENLHLFGNLHGVDKATLKQRATDLVGEADFAQAAGR
ncbi:MAG: hypothetical protein GWN58_65815, partial [Anaerolineae bacterium]|nr:hypothetical protein [Anaerolineae bacterium]